jgi:AcrR family transcriptional regulator
METKEKILEESEKLFMRYGLRSVSMDDVAGSLGMSKKTIYNFLKDKKDLVYQVIQRHFSCEEQKCRFIFAENINPVAQMISMGHQVSKNMKSLNPTVVHDLRKFFPRSWDIFLDYRKNVIQRNIITNLENGVKEGFYRKDIDIEINAKFYLTLTESLADPSVFNTSEKSLDVLVREVIRYHLNGVCTEKGRAYMNEHISEL